MKGEEFETWEELEEYVDEDDDAKMKAFVMLVIKHGEDLPRMLEELRTCRVEDWREADIALITTHKAKGLEFPLVELAQDFCRPIDDETGELQPAERVRKPYFQEELNILYVAITRAKRLLRLSPDAEVLFGLLRDHGFVDDTPVHAPDTAISARMKELEAIREGDQVRWKLFEEAVKTDPKFVIDTSTVPFPRGPAGNVLALSDDMPIENAQQAIAQGLLRYHPDKFMGLFGAKVQPDQNGAGSRLRQKLAEVTRSLLQMRRDYTLSGKANAAIPNPPANECPICMLLVGPADGRELLRTSCCRRQRLCRDCYAGVAGHNANPKCPFCRASGFKAEDPQLRPTQPQKGTAVHVLEVGGPRSRSRSRGRGSPH